MTDHEHPAWYRQFWPWFLMSLPLAAVLAGVATFWMAARSADGLVDDDYYKKGMTINRTLDRDRVATQAGLVAHMQMSTQRVTLVLQGRLARWPDHLVLRILHPTRAGMDQQVMLTHQGAGRYLGAARLPAPGKWHLLLKDEGGVWRLLGDWRDTQPEVVLRPARVE